MAMNLGDAVLKIGADTKDLDKSLQGMKDKVKSSMQKMQGSIKAVGVAFTAAGAAGLALVSSARKMNAQLSQTGMTIGATTGEMRKLALSTTNVTFPLKSVVATFDILAKAGIRDQKILKKTATAFDTLADATGSTAEEVAKRLIPAFKALGEDIPETAEELDKFTWLAKNTTVTIDEFGGVMAYVAQFGDDLNLSLEDMVAIMGVLESKGKSGSTATKMFRTALSQAAAGTATLNEALGITTEEIDGMKVSIDGATGSTQAYADAANKQFGIMDKLKQKFSELTFQLGSYLTPLEPVLAAMTALGPIFLILSTNMGIATVAWIAHTIAMIASTITTAAMTAAQWLLNAAMTANPIGAVVIAIGALIAAGYLLVKEWERVVSFFRKAWEIISGDVSRSMKEMAESRTALTEDTLAIIKQMREKEKQDRLAGMDEERRAAQDLHDATIKNIEEEFGVLEDAQRSKVDLLRDASEEAKRALGEELARSREVHNAKIAMLDFEFNQKIRTLNAETNADIAAIQAEIDAIDEQTKEEDRIRKEQERAQRLVELEAAVASAKTAEERVVADERLANHVVRVARERLLEGRAAEKEALRDRITEVRLNAQTEEERLKKELEGKKELESGKQLLLENRLEREKEKLDTALAEEIMRLEEEEFRARWVAAKRLQTTQNRLKEETKAINEEYAKRLEDAARQREALGRIRSEAATPSIPGLQHGGIVTRPMIARIGEAGPEAVVPLRGGMMGAQMVHITLELDGEPIYEKMVDLIRLRTGTTA